MAHFCNSPKTYELGPHKENLLAQILESFPDNLMGFVVQFILF